MAYVKKNQMCYVCLVCEDDRVYCAGVSLHAYGVLNYTAVVEQDLREKGYELEDMRDNWKYGESYVSYWSKGEHEVTVIIQKSALAQ